jgi:hypothetical protein
VIVCVAAPVPLGAVAFSPGTFCANADVAEPASRPKPHIVESSQRFFMSSSPIE